MTAAKVTNKHTTEGAHCGPGRLASEARSALEDARVRLGSLEANAPPRRPTSEAAAGGRTRVGSGRRTTRRSVSGVRGRGQAQQREAAANRWRSPSETPGVLMRAQGDFA